MVGTNWTPAARPLALARAHTATFRIAGSLVRRTAEAAKAMDAINIPVRPTPAKNPPSTAAFAMTLCAAPTRDSTK
jgi:hypothetical protein